MSLILGKNASNELQPCQMDGFNNIKVDIAGNSSGTPLAVDATIVGDTVGLSTEATSSAMNVNLNTLAGAVSGTEFQVDVLSSALPTGAASETTLLSVDTSLTTVVAQEATLAGQALNVSSIDSKITQGYDLQIASGGNGLQQALCYGRDASGNLDALTTDASGHLEVVVDDFVKGQALMAASFPVVIASDQSAISVSSAGGSTTNVNDVLATGAGGTATSTAVDMDGFSNLTFFGSSDNTMDIIQVEVSHNNSTWIEASEYYINGQFVGSDVHFSVNVANTGARYWRVRQTDTLATAFTLTVNSSKK